MESKLLLLRLSSLPSLRPLNRQRSRTTHPYPKHPTLLSPLQYRRSSCPRQSLCCKSQLGGMCFARMPSSSGPAQRVSIDYRRYQRLRLSEVFFTSITGRAPRSSRLPRIRVVCSLQLPPTPIPQPHRYRQHRVPYPLHITSSAH